MIGTSFFFLHVCVWLIDTNLIIAFDFMGEEKELQLVFKLMNFLFYIANQNGEDLELTSPCKLSYCYQKRDQTTRIITVTLA